MLALLALLGWIGAAVASDVVSTTPDLSPPTEPQTTSVSCEINGEHAYVGKSKTKAGVTDLGRVTEQSSGLNGVVSQHLSEGVILRTGVGWQRYSFGLPDAAPFPTTLQTVNAVIGADFELSDQWLMRIEMQPGFYSDFEDLSFDDVNAPLIAGFSYLVDKDLQWFFGLSVDARRRYPVLPGGGLRWKFASQWTLMFLMPKPRIEYDWSEHLTLYAGADLQGGTFKVGKNFGDNHGRQNFNNATLDFSEARVGLGLTWKVRPGITLDVGGGYMVYRQFDYHTADVSFDGDPAPYGQIGITANF